MHPGAEIDFLSVVPKQVGGRAVESFFSLVPEDIGRPVRPGDLHQNIDSPLAKSDGADLPSLGVHQCECDMAFDRLLHATQVAPLDHCHLGDPPSGLIQETRQER